MGPIHAMLNSRRRLRRQRSRPFGGEGSRTTQQMGPSSGCPLDQISRDASCVSMDPRVCHPTSILPHSAETLYSNTYRHLPHPCGRLLDPEGSMIVALVSTLRVACRMSESWTLESLALHQQLTVHQRDPKYPRLRAGDRIFWVLLRRLESDGGRMPGSRPHPPPHAARGKPRGWRPPTTGSESITPRFSHSTSVATG